jgi:hypothetical protein
LPHSGSLTIRGLKRAQEMGRRWGGVIIQKANWIEKGSILMYNGHAIADYGFLALSGSERR